VQTYLKDRILDGRLAPGTRIVEAQMAQELGVSRTPVREALHILQSEGFLEGLSGVGYRVRGLSWKEVEEICEIRVVNETLAAVWAARRITPDELRALERNLDLAEQQVRGGSPESFVERDAEFHEILARASGSEHLLELCQLLRRHMLRYRVKSLYRLESALTAIAGHRRVLDCLKRSDEEALRRAVKDHIEQSKEDVRRRAFETEEERAACKESTNA
jgi:DNA-binding GntR family transcriptional regulator